MACHVVSTMTSKIAKPDILKMLTSYRPTKARTALWFFRQKYAQLENSERKPKAKACHIWRELSAEDKRIYHSMSEVDLLRFKAENKLWLAKCSVALDSDKRADELEKVLFKELGNDYVSDNNSYSFSDCARSYGNKVNLETIRDLYRQSRDVIERINDANHSEELDGETKDRLERLPEGMKFLLQRPRRPLGPFMLYFYDRMKQYREQSGKEIPTAKIVSSEWKQLDEETKALYLEKYEKANKSYVERVKIYNEIGAGQNQIIRRANNENKIYYKKLRKRLQELNVPKKARSALNFFLQEHLKDRKYTLKEALELWRSMSDEEKSKYLEMQGEDRLRFEREAATWKLMSCRENVKKLFGTPETTPESDDDTAQ